MADISVNDFRNLFNTGADGAVSKTSIAKTEGYVTLAGGEGEERVENAGRKWSERSSALTQELSARGDDNRRVRNLLVGALEREGASAEFLAKVRGQLGLAVNPQDPEHQEDAEKVQQPLERRTLKRILSGFDKDVKVTAMTGAMREAGEEFRKDQQLQNKGVKNPTLAAMLSLAQEHITEDVVNGGFSRIIFKDGKIDTDDNLGKFAKSGLAKSDKDFVKTSFTFIQHKMESGLGWRALARTAAEKDENNQIRMMFLVSVMGELQKRGIKNVNFQNLPTEIKDALKLDDFGESVQVVGDKVRVVGGYGRPLTAHRITEVVEAINSVFGTMQDAKVSNKESAILGVFTGRIMPSSTTAMSKRSVGRGIRTALGIVRAHAGDRQRYEESFKFSGQRMTLVFDHGDLAIRIGGKEAAFPGGCAAFVRLMEKEVATHVKYYGKDFINAEMARLESGQVPAELQQRDLSLGLVKQNAALANWRHEKQGALIGFYQDVLRSVIGEEAYKQLPIGNLPLAGLRLLAKNALGGAYSSRRSVNALIAEVTGYGDKLQLSNETIIAVAATYDAEKASGLAAGKVSIRHEDTTRTREDLEDEADRIVLDSQRLTMRRFVAETVLEKTVASGRASVGQKLLAAAVRDPQTFIELVDRPERALELFDDGAEDAKTEVAQRAEGNVRTALAQLLHTLKDSPSWVAFCGSSFSAEVRSKVVLPLLSVALVYGTESPEVADKVKSLRELNLGFGTNLMKSMFLLQPTLTQKLDEMLAVFRDPEFALGELDGETMAFVADVGKRDHLRVELEKSIKAPKPMTAEEIDKFLVKQELDLDSKKVHGFVADLLLGHDTVQSDLERRSSMSPAAKMLRKVMRNFDGFTLILKRTDYALKTFNFEVGGQANPNPDSNPQQPSLTEQLRQKIAGALDKLKSSMSFSYQDGNGEQKTVRLGEFLANVPEAYLKTLFTLMTIAAESGPESAQFSEALKAIEDEHDRFFGPLVSSIFGTSTEPNVESVKELLVGIGEAGEALDAELATAVETSLDGIAGAMEAAVVEAFDLSPEDVNAIRANLNDQEAPGEMVGFDERTEWRKTLSDYTGGNALNPRVGLGKFIVRSLLTYFNRPSSVSEGLDPDKAHMVASLIRYTKHDSSAGEILGALLKGAGPIMQKLLQGIPSEGLPADMATALSGMKDDLAPIDDHIVEAQLYNMVKESKGRIRSIEVLESLGAASVGQAFRCLMTKADNTTEQVVVKLLRPDVANRAQREKDFFRGVAANVRGMKHTFEGQLSTILDELDLTIEAGNIQLGAVYHENPDVRIKSVEVHPLVRPTTDTLVMKLAPGKTITRFVKEARERMAEIRREITRFEKMSDGNLRTVYMPATHARFIQLRRELVELGKGLAARNQMLTSLTTEWVGEAVFKNGFFHGDLHAGNIMSDGQTMTVIDFGNATKLSAKEQENLVKVVCACAGHRADDFMDGFRALLSPDGRRAMDRANARIRPMVEAILKKGTSGETGQRITAVISLLQQNGIEIPSQINKFTQSMLRLCDAVTQTESATNEVDALLRILGTPVIKRDGEFCDDVDLEYRAFRGSGHGFQEQELDHAVEFLRKAGSHFEAHARRALEVSSTGLTSYSFTTPVVDGNGEPVMVDSGMGYLVQDVTAVTRSFDRAIPDVIEQMIAAGPTVDIQEGQPPVDLAAQARKQYAEYLEAFTKLDQELRGGAQPQFGLNPDIPLREAIRDAMSESFNLAYTSLPLELRKAEDDEQKAAIQRRIDEAKTRMDALKALEPRMNEKAIPLIMTLAKISEIQGNHLADEIEAGHSDGVPDPDGFSESFSQCAFSNVKSAIQKLGLIDGYVLGKAVKEHTNAESDLHDHTESRLGLYANKAGSAELSTQEDFAATMLPLVNETLTRSAVAFVYPEDINEALEGGAWKNNPEKRSQVFEMLAHNLSQFRKELIASANFTTADFLLGSDEDGYPQQDAGGDYDRALRRFRLTGMLLYALDGVNGKMPGLIAGLQTNSEQEFTDMVSALGTWAAQNPELCDDGVCQMVKDVLALASYGPEVNNMPFCPKLFENEDGVTLALGDKWSAEILQEKAELDARARKQRQAIENTFAPRIPGINARLATKNVLKEPEDANWQAILEPRAKFHRIQKKYALAEGAGIHDAVFVRELSDARAEYDKALKDAATANCETVRRLIDANPTWLVDGKLDPSIIAQSEVPKQEVSDAMFDAFMAAAQTLEMPATEADRALYRTLLTLLPPNALSMLEPGSRNLDDRQGPANAPDQRATNAAAIAAAIKELLKPPAEEQVEEPAEEQSEEQIEEQVEEPAEEQSEEQIEE